MSETTGYAEGQPCWIDLTEPDLDRARAFYAAVLGWSYEVGGPEYGGYVLCRSEGSEVGGMMSPVEGVPHVWTLYFATADAAATVARIGEAGGEVVFPPMEVPGQGTMAYARDPGGAGFGIWQPKGRSGIRRVGEPGGYAWADLATREPDRSDDFFRTVFGYEQRRLETVPGMDYTVWHLEGQAVCGRVAITADRTDRPGWVVYFAVTDTDAAAERITDAGGTVRDRPFDSPYGRIAMAEDPAGATFAIVDQSQITAT